MVDLYPILRGAAPAGGGAEEVGNKAWNLMRMAQAGLPVPAAFVLPTTWRRRTDAGRGAALRRALAEGVARLETATGLSFGASRRPLLVSVRSGAAISMPGMMETVLDIGLNLETAGGLVRLTGNPRLAWDSYRRLIQGYAEVVAGLPTAPFDALATAALKQADVETERGLDHRDLRALTLKMLEGYRSLRAEAPFLAIPTSNSPPPPQPCSAHGMRRRRRASGASTASATTRAPPSPCRRWSMAMRAAPRARASGSREIPRRARANSIYDFRFNAQGEDVVAGRQRLSDNERLRKALPGVWLQLNDVCRQLEALAGDAQDFEFTVQSEALYLLQTRRAKRTPWAAVTIAVDLVEEGALTPAQGLALLEGVDLDAVTRTRFAPSSAKPLAVAELAGIGVASGAVALDSEAVKHACEAGTPAILVRQETVTSDIEGMAKAAGILTASGGRTSHAAVVARQLGKVCLVACPGLSIDLTRRQCRIGEATLDEGDFLSLDGNSGAVYAGRLEPAAERPERALAAIAAWRRAGA